MTKLTQEVQNILAKAKVSVVSETVSRQRNERGHFIPGSGKVRVVLTGHGVSDGFKRHYFKRTRLPLIQAVAPTANLPRVKKNSGEVVLELAC